MKVDEGLFRTNAASDLMLRVKIASSFSRITILTSRCSVSSSPAPNAWAPKGATRFRRSGRVRTWTSIVARTEATASGSCSYRLLPPLYQGEQNRQDQHCELGVGGPDISIRKPTHSNESFADAGDGLLDPAGIDAKLLNNGEEALKQCQERSGRDEADSRKVGEELDLSQNRRSTRGLRQERDGSTHEQTRVKPMPGVDRRSKGADECLDELPTNGSGCNDVGLDLFALR